MSAGLIWEHCKLNEELNKLISIPYTYEFTNNFTYDTKFDSLKDNEAKRVLSNTNCFRNDVYSLPPGVDPKVTNLYPLLHQIYTESHSLTEYDLQKLAYNIQNNHSNTHQHNTYYKEFNTPFRDSNGQYRDSNGHYRESNGHFRDSNVDMYNSYRDCFGVYKTPTSTLRNILNDYRPYDTNYGVSDPYKYSTFTSYTRPHNLFNTNLSTIKSSDTSQYHFDPTDVPTDTIPIDKNQDNPMDNHPMGIPVDNRMDNVRMGIPVDNHMDIPMNNPMDKVIPMEKLNMFNTPNYIKSVNHMDNLQYNRTYNNGPYDNRPYDNRQYDNPRPYDRPYNIYNSVENSVDEFRKAFQPGNEYRNEYTTVETPIPDTTRLNDYNDEFVSSFPFEKSLNNYFNNQDYPGYNDEYPYGYNRDQYGKNMEYGKNMDYGKNMEYGINFNPNSPLKSMMNDDYQYNYHKYITPQRPFY